MALRGLKFSVRNCLNITLSLALLCVFIPVLWPLIKTDLLLSSFDFGENTEDVKTPDYIDTWRSMNNISNSLPKKLNMFKMRLGEEELVLMLEMLDDFSKTMDKYNLTYFMDAGTLLGSYRHHGMIPWDDDIDLFADVEQYKQVRTALDTIKDKYVVSVHSKGLLKLHSRNNSNNTLYRTKTSTYAWKWPFLDIFWFRRSGSRMYKLYNNEIYRVSDMFPLGKRPFGTLMLNSPCNTDLFLNKKFHNWKLCATPNWSHMKERGTGLRKVKQDCGVMYPVVQRTSFKNETTLEYLYYNGTLVSQFVEHSKCLN